jgi:signal transduction histidine kinase
VHDHAAARDRVHNLRTMSGLLRKSGIAPLGDIAWGTHFCHFFQSTEDLFEVAAPYFAAGLRHNERCIWLLTEQITKDVARDALRKAIPDFDSHEAKGAFSFQSASYLHTGAVDLEAIVGVWTKLIAELQQQGFAGVRAAAAELWSTHEQWRDFRDHERRLESVVRGKPIVVLCSFPLDTTDAAGLLDVASSHQLAIVKREGTWNVVETPVLRLTQLDYRNRQQAAISALGLTAIRERNTVALFNEAASLAATTLGTDRSIVWQVSAEQNELILRARFGWKELPEVTIVRILDGSAARHSLNNDQAVIITDIAGDNRFTSSWVLRDYRVATMISAVIRGQRQPWGVLSVHSLSRRSFNEDDVQFLQSMANVLALAIERDEQEASVRAARERLESLSRRLLTVQEEERRRVAIELHDELGQVLTAVKIGLESNPVQLSESIESVDRAMQTVRDLALELRPAMLDDLGLPSALRWYADRFARQTHLKIHIAIQELRELDAGVATAAFRVAQEALTNVARHAAAKNVWLQLCRESSQLELVVRDDGSGFDVDAAHERAVRGGSLGLLGMEERVSLAGGSLAIISTAETGTEVRARFPSGGALP